MKNLMCRQKTRVFSLSLEAVEKVAGKMHGPIVIGGMRAVQ